MKKIAIILSALFGMCRISAAGTFYNSPHLSTASGMADMGLAGTFSFYASTLAGGTNNPTMVMSSTGGIYAAGFLGIEMATVTARIWIKTASMTVSGQVQAGTFVGDGSGIFNLSTGGAVNPIAIAAATTSIFNQLTSTGISLQQLWSSSLSTWTALVSTGVSLSRFQTAINISTTQINTSTTSLFTNLNSTGVSLSNLWTSAVSTYTSLTSTGVALSKLQSAISISTPAFTASTTTLAIATAALQSVDRAMTLSTTTLSLSTATLKARLDAFITVNSTVQTRIDQLQVFASTGQTLIRDLSNSTAAIRSSIAGGVIALYDNGGTFLGNITTLKLGNNIIGSVTGISAATGTIIAITTTSSSGGSGVVNIFTIVDNVPATLQQVSTFNLLTNEFTREVNGTSQTWRISNSTHIYTAVQYFTAVNMTSATLATNLTAGGSGVFGGALSGLNLTSVNLSTYPYVDLTDGNNVWRTTIRNTPGNGKKIFVMKDQTGGYERFQFDLSSGNIMVGGDPIGGLNSYTPTNAKFTVVGGSFANIGANAQIFVQGLIKSASGFVFPDGSVQQTAQLVAGVSLKTYVDNLNPVSISSINYPTSEFTWSTIGTSGTLSVSQTTHNWVTQNFSSANFVSASFSSATISNGVISTLTVPVLLAASSMTASVVFTSTNGIVVRGSTITSINIENVHIGKTPNGEYQGVTFGSLTNKTGIFSSDDLKSQLAFRVNGSTAFTLGQFISPTKYFELESNFQFQALIASGSLVPAYAFGGGSSGLYKQPKYGQDVAGISQAGVPCMEFLAAFNQSYTSFTAMDVITSTVGFIAPSATFTATNSSKYLVNGNSLFVSTTGGHQYDGYSLYIGTGQISPPGFGNSVATISVSGLSSVIAPMIQPYFTNGSINYVVKTFLSSFTVSNIDNQTLNYGYSFLGK